MTRFIQEFKVQSVEKALSKHPDQTIENIAKNLDVNFLGAIEFQLWTVFLPDCSRESLVHISKWVKC